MEIIGDIKKAEEKVLEDVNSLLEEMRSIVTVTPKNSDEGVSQLAQLRECAYEDLNQIQHEHLILQSAKWLVARSKVPESASWSWNPRQTGGADEPDLEAKENNCVLVSCEITTSRRPIGTIAERMKKTLSKLSAFDGEKYYFVRTQEMLKRANKYIKEGEWGITSVCIESDL